MSSGAGLGQSEQDYEGRIVAAVPDKSFTVAYTGTRSFKQQYVLKDGKYALIGKDTVPGCCGERDETRPPQPYRRRNTVDRRQPQIGRAQDCTPVTNTQIVSRHLIEKKNHYTMKTTI